MSEKSAPEIRFKGYTVAWERRKLNNILKERKMKQKISEEVPLLAFAAGQGVIDRSERKTNNRDFLTKNFVKKTYLFTKYNDIVYNPSNLKYGAIDRNKHGQGVISPIYITFETDEIPSFIELILKSENFKQRALHYEEGTVTKRQSVKPENLLSLDIVLPNNKNEQIKIGKFFERLDDTIALHQRKLDKLKQLKQGYLKLIFDQNVRFFGFTDEWNTSVLESLADFTKGIGYSKADLKITGTPIILYGRLYTKYETVIHSVDTYAIKNEKSFMSKGNEVIIPSSGETAEDISRASVVAVPDIIIGGDLNIVIPHEKINSTFLALNISNGKQQKELSRYAQGKSVVHLQNSDLKKINLIYPDLKEQIKISKFFTRIEDNITLQEQKISKLKKLKKVYLQKMFI